MIDHHTEQKAKTEELSKGDIVQITNAGHHWYPALIIVDEVKTFGILGYATNVDNTAEPNHPAYIRLKTEDFEKVGRAAIAVL